MKINTIKWRIFKYNLIVIITLIALVAVIFNVSIRIYFERDIMDQLSRIARRTEDIALRQGPRIFALKNAIPALPEEKLRSFEVFSFYAQLERSLRESLSVLNAEYLLLDKDANIISSPIEWQSTLGMNLLDKISAEINNSGKTNKESFLNLNISGTEYIAVVKPVSKKNSFRLGWIVVYSGLEKANELLMAINMLLLVILLLSAFIITIFSSVVSKKITAPFSTLNMHIRSIAERNFGNKIDTPVYDELSEFVNSINIMSEKLETHDKAQKTFLQNASHEFRTPLMSIQSYAEGIKYNVTDTQTSADIIIDESKRLTQLVENLLYLSRLDAIEESYCFSIMDYNELIRGCVERMNRIAAKDNISISIGALAPGVMVRADDEKLSRAVTNILSNCIRYAKSSVTIKTETTPDNMVRTVISDDGPGFDCNELPNIFERFFRGAKGNFGLGLAITKAVIEKHNGKITALNSENGAEFRFDIPLAQ